MIGGGPRRTRAEVSVVAEASELCAKAAAGLYCLEEHPLEEHTAMKRRKEEAKSRSR